MDKNELVRWIVRNVTEHEVPADEGNSEGLVWNLIQLALHGPGYDRYAYRLDQHQMLGQLYRQYGRFDWTEKELEESESWEFPIHEDPDHPPPLGVHVTDQLKTREKLGG